MNKWQATFLGLKQLPRELSGFEIEAFFTFTATERALIDARRASSLKLGLALQIGFLRMSGRLLDAVHIVPPALWKHLCNQFGEPAPDLAFRTSVRCDIPRRNLRPDHQGFAYPPRQNQHSQVSPSSVSTSLIRRYQRQRRSNPTKSPRLARFPPGQRTQDHP
jgi:Domain of unknown function (DUF4158)